MPQRATVIVTETTARPTTTPPHCRAPTPYHATPALDSPHTVTLAVPITATPADSHTRPPQSLPLATLAPYHATPQVPPATTPAVF